MFPKMKVSVLGNRKGIYIDPRDCMAYLDVSEAGNYDKVRHDFIYATVRREDNGSFNLVQIQGYNPTEGVFIEMVE